MAKQKKQKPVRGGPPYEGMPRVWTQNADHRREAEAAVIRLLEFVGEDTFRGGLLETPRRYVDALLEMTKGYTQRPADLLKCFEDGAEGYDELVLQRHIPLWSMCEHHLAPFFGVAHIAYIPNGKVVGLSKLARLTDAYAHRLQVQERLTAQIARTLNDVLKPRGVGVILECRHTCIECRGVRKSGSVTTTSALHGVFKTKPEARAELLSLIHKS
jgi:GTP cyclohydrolase I